MPFALGIDEAGYGPLLGPLVVGGTLWRVDTSPHECDFWERLKTCVSRSASAREQSRLPVGDSKEVFDRKRGVYSLERTVLAFAAAAGQPWNTLDALLASVEFDRESVRELPWYRNLEMSLPTDTARSGYEGIAVRLRDTMAASKTECIGLNAWVVSESRFNSRVVATRNKSAVVIEAVLGLIAWAGQRIGDGELFVFVDRLGGRANYRDILAQSFPDRHVHVLLVSEEASKYRLATQRSDWWVEFSVEGEQRHLPIALSSMLAKYVRELLMTRFNDYWRTLMPELRPTAGYYSDAERFLADIDRVRELAGLSTGAFVRSR